MLRFLAMRKRHVIAVCLNPKSRPRHENIDVKVYLERRRSDYVEFFDDRSTKLSCVVCCALQKTC